MRPVIEGEVLAADGSWLPVELLLDTGADRTVFSAPILAALALSHATASQQLGGVGGAVSTVVITTRLRLPVDGGSAVAFQGSFAGFTQTDALDMSVLGRDILNLFAVIVDKPGDLVCLIGMGHSYTITPQP